MKEYVGIYIKIEKQDWDGALLWQQNKIFLPR